MYSLFLISYIKKSNVKDSLSSNFILFKYNMHRLNQLYESIKINYKSWILLFIVLCVIDNENLLYMLVTLLIMLVTLQLFHHMSHYDIFYPFSCAHLYHHNHNNFFSHFIQIIIEFIFILSPITIKYVLKYILSFDIKLFETYHIIFIYLFYTTVHNINYSVLHVNDVHEYHHFNPLKNAGPDICDILFNTKHDPENKIENTDHFIPNIIFSFIIVFVLKYIYKWINNENLVLNSFIYIMSVLMIFLILSSIVIFMNDIDIFYKKKLEDFCEKL